MERIDMKEIMNTPGPDLFEKLAGKINELIDERDVLIERIAKLEAGADELTKRVDTTQKAAFKVVEQIALHSHDAQGRASIPLAV